MRNSSQFNTYDLYWVKSTLAVEEYTFLLGNRNTMMAGASTLPFHRILSYFVTHDGDNITKHLKVSQDSEKMYLFLSLRAQKFDALERDDRIVLSRHFVNFGIVNFGLQIPEVKKLMSSVLLRVIACFAPATSENTCQGFERNRFRKSESAS